MESQAFFLSDPVLAVEHQHWMWLLLFLGQVKKAVPGWKSCEAAHNHAAPAPLKMEVGPGSWTGFSGLRAEGRVYSAEGTLWTKLWAKTQRERCRLGPRAANHATVGTLVHNPDTDAAGPKEYGTSPYTQGTVHEYVCVLRVESGRQNREYVNNFTDTHNPSVIVFTSKEA